jgi:hypothetical protein
VSLEGLPNFDATLDAAPALSPILGAPGEFGVMPAGLSIAAAGGSIDMSLDIFRGNQPGTGTAMLALAVSVDYDTEAALATARQANSQATVRALAWSDGAVWLDLPHLSGAQVSKPTPLTPSGVGTGRILMPVQLDDAELLAGLLEDTSSATGSLSASAVVVVTGAGARAPAAVRFNPLDLAGDLAAAALTEVDPATLTAHWHEAPPSWLSVEPAPQTAMTAQVMTAFSARVCTQLCTWNPTAGLPGHGAFIVGKLLPGIMQWDLSQQAAVRRPVPLSLDQADLAQILATVPDRSALVHRVAPPPVDLGLVTVPVYSRLPRPIAGALAIGVTVRAPARMPQRPFDVLQSVECDPAGRFPAVSFDRGAGAGLGGPDDPLLQSGYAVVAAPDGAHRSTGPERTAEPGWISVGGDDLGAQLAVVEITEPLRALATATVTGTRPGLDPVVATLDAPPSLIALLGPATGDPPAEMSIALTSRTDAAQLVVGPLRWADQRLDVSDLPTFGAQTVHIRATWPDGVQLALIELQPESAPGLPAPPVTTVRLQPEVSERSWTYAAQSPFHAGYRYRLSAAPGDPAQPWSAVLDPRQALTVSVPGASTPPPAAVETAPSGPAAAGGPP